MKILIWLGCIFISALIQTLLEMTIGISFPLLQFLAMCAVARYLCKQWDERRLNQSSGAADSNSEFGYQSKQKEQSMTSPLSDIDLNLEEVPSAFARRFCEQMEEVHSYDEKEIIENAAMPEQRNEKQIFEESSTIKDEKEKEMVLISKIEAQAIEEKPNAQDSTLVQDNNQVACSNPFDVLKNLKELNDAGIITDDEYAEKKKEVLKRI